MSFQSENGCFIRWYEVALNSRKMFNTLTTWSNYTDNDILIGFMR